MKGLAKYAIPACAAAVVTIAWGGHELPVYPSFYPHEIEIKSLAPAQASEALRRGAVQAYVGPGLHLSGALPTEIGALESLGAFVVVRVDPGSPHARDEAAACAAVKAVVRVLAGHSDVVVHPYPVTPFHGDYLHHADLATAAKARLSDGGADDRGVRIKGSGSLAQNHPEWFTRDSNWDVEIVEVDAAGLTASAMLSMNGWLAPPWLKAGWFHAERLLADTVNDADRRQRAESDLARLRAGDFSGLIERINLERDLVTALTGSCRKIVAGYTVKREYVNVEYSAGIENIGYDSIEGLASPIFVRTVKLKDFPWNGWLALGTGGKPAAAWNPIGGMNDPFGRLIGFAVGDSALLPSPYDAGWTLNRISDVASNPGR